MPFDEYAVDELRSEPMPKWRNQFCELFRRDATGELSTLSCFRVKKNKGKSKLVCPRHHVPFFHLRNRHKCLRSSTCDWVWCSHTSHRPFWFCNFLRIPSARIVDNAPMRLCMVARSAPLLPNIDLSVIPDALRAFRRRSCTMPANEERNYYHVYVSIVLKIACKSTHAHMRCRWHVGFVMCHRFVWGILCKLSRSKIIQRMHGQWWSEPRYIPSTWAHTPRAVSHSWGEIAIRKTHIVLAHIFFVQLENIGSNREM